MEKKKRRVCFLLTVVGIIIIIITQTVISIDNDAKERQDNYIKENAVIAAKKCTNDKVCSLGNISFSTLIEEEYFTKEFINDLIDYSLDSYVEYPDYKVILKRKSK